MVGLVAVSHSHALARAAVALAAEMVAGLDVPIEIAAGLDETTFGTDAVAIAAAVTTADRGDGVVVIMDLGSAVLSAELALELLAEEDLRDRVVLCPAPFVEGLIAAAVVAAGGAGRQEVADEAAAALTGKQTQLGTAPAGGEEPGTPTGPSATITVTNPHGLHARPAARLVARLREYDARVELRNRTTGSAWVPAGSFSRVATLGAQQGHEIEVRASGPQGREAVDELVALAARAFDEAPDTPPASPAPPPAQPGGPPPEPGALAQARPDAAVLARPDAAVLARPDAAGAVLVGQPASPGIGIGPAWRPRAAVPALPDTPSLGSEPERRRVEDALTAVRRDLQQIRAATARDAGNEHAAIFDAHLLLLADTELLADVRARLADGLPAPQAWAAATTRIAAEFEALADPYLQARAADVRAVADQVLRALLGLSGAARPKSPAPPGTAPQGSGRPPTGSDGPPSPAPAPPGVLIAAELTPAEAAALDPGRVAGVLLAFGSPTAHGAILARARGVPAVVGLGAAMLEVPEGTPVAMDGGSGEVAPDPAPALLAAFRERAAEQEERRRQATARAGRPAVTRDGVTIAVAANVGSAADARAAAAHGADLAGLVRTEFLFLGRDSAPDADGQEAAYREIAEALPGRRITIRTLDVGGDKPLPYLPVPAEDNPFLGVRGIRHSLAHPALLAEQLLAIVRVARDVPVSVMFPMVSTVSEVVRARQALDEAVARAGGGRPSGLRVGIMVEVPAAALKIAAFRPYLDFVSIGTNDLTQYALAAERGNAALTALADGLDPGVLRLVDAVCRGAGGMTVAVCGELAGDEAAVPLLTGLGVRELSVTPRSIPAVKEAVRATSLDLAAPASAAALTLPDAAAVRATSLGGPSGHR
jgi:phosphoenolpyruvate-protein phosphotransferase/dihydroxyacetone kinase phosphotransfer subunit